MNYQTIKMDCDIVGIPFENIDSITIRDLIQAYRRKAVKTHPDKVGDAHKEEATEAFKVLNNAYEKLLKFLVEKAKSNSDINKHEVNEEESEEQKFTEEYFKHFNFPTENDGSFTVNIQHYQADAWQDNLEKIYGTPTIHKTSKGTVTDTFWQFKYTVEEEETVITLHIYNKPQNKKKSKLMIQSGNKSLVCIFVFSELPRIFKNISTSTLVMEDKKRNASLVKCTQCKVKATLTGMKMHLKTAHATPKSDKKSRKSARTAVVEQVQTEFECDNSECDYKINNRNALRQHIDAVHLIPWKLRLQETETCRKCGFGIEIGKLDEHMKDKHAEIEYLNAPEISIIDIDSREIEDTNIEDVGHVEERNCPTPIPESLFICGECFLGLESESDVDRHMKNYQTEILGDERIKYLEAQLKAEKEQNTYSKEALEEALKKVTYLEQRVEFLEALNANQEAQVNNLKKEVEEKEKIITKSNKKHTEEINELKRQQLLTSENLRSTVLEKEVLKENDRILLNTFDMLKKYIDQIKEQNFEKNNDHKCQECDHIAKSIGELSVHMESTHEGKCFQCDQCESKFDSEDKLLKHSETKHSEQEKHEKGDSEKCRNCEYRSKNSNDLTNHENSVHRSDELFDCEKCKFDTTIKANFERHMKTHHSEKANRNATPCIFWNQGVCHYGLECRFVHEEIPACKFQEKCENYRCAYFHYNKSWNSFLGKGLRHLSQHNQQF